MKSKTSIALAIATALITPAAMADEAGQAPKSKCVPPVGENCPGAATKKKAAPVKEKEAAVETPVEPVAPPPPEPATEPAPPPEGLGGGPVEQEPMPPPAPTTTTMTQTTVVTDEPAMAAPVEKRGPRIRRGFGINGFGSFGARDDARWGLGGRIEYVTRIGLAVGGSYVVHWESEGDRTQVRPLLGEIGWSIPIAPNLELRPMVGIGVAFLRRESATYTNDQGQTVTANVVTNNGFDVAPGAKLSYMASILEIYTMPKYHFINGSQVSGNNFFGLELGAGARF